MKKEILASLSPYATDRVSWSNELGKFSQADQAWIIAEFLCNNVEPFMNSKEVEKVVKSLAPFVKNNPVFEAIMDNVEDRDALIKLGVDLDNNFKLIL
jgi:hypothetical protein